MDRNLGSVVLIVVLDQTITFLLQGFYETNQLLRKLLLGNQFVEGTWIEFVSQNKKIVSVGIAVISSKDYEIQINGNNFDLNGNLNYGFSSTANMARMEWPIFRYVYEDRPLQGSQDTLAGVAHIKFGPTNNRPTIYAGSFTHIGTGILVGLEGRRVTSTDELRLLSNPSEMRKVLKKYLQQRLQEVHDRKSLATEIEKPSGS